MSFWSKAGENLRSGTLAVAGTIYELADAALLGALPNTLQGTQISNVGGSGTEKSIVLAAASEAGAVPTAVTAGLPQTGTAVGVGIGNLAYQGVSGIGAGIGSGVLGGNPQYGGQGLLGTSGSLGGALSDAGKPLIVAGAVVVGLLVILMATNKRTGTVQPIAVAAPAGAR